MQLTIEKLIYGGDGLAHLPADERGQGKAVFVPFVLPGEKAEVTLAENKPGFARARLNRVLEAAPERVEPSCPYFGRCGGCQYQHASYDQQLKIKSEILRETLRRTAKLEFEDEIRVHASPPWNYRNRARMRVAQQSPSTEKSRSLASLGMTPPERISQPDDPGDVGRGFAIGYNHFQSNALLPVRECPISSQLILRALQAVWKLGEEGKVPAAIVEIEFFANAEDTELLLEITVDTRRAPTPSAGSGQALSRPLASLRGKLHEARQTGGTAQFLEGLAEFARELRQELPAVVGVVPFQASGNASVVRLDVPEELSVDLGNDFLVYRTANANYRVSAGSFFQTNRFLVDEMIGLVTEGRTGGFALDLYSGVGLFSLALSQNFRQVAAVESAPFSFHDLQANSPSNVTGYRVEVDKFLAQVPPETRFDYVVVDPPRGGLGEKVAAVAAGLKAPQFTYVSCDPATLARDLRVLMQSGYRIREMHLLDLFPQTFHIESVVFLAL